ncbi:DUF1657 domain-containing protein [Aquibacillus kalidii]|uniref:DUF1657 domain-containing protein n=1 Tax=Aquibacillus kalidii TaxID=2762597 RepID=UPI001645A111|nr:DUF1657 domain-containing protein [Aquibacillus kalidii]
MSESTQVKHCIANIKYIQSTLSSLSNGSQTEDASQVFNDTMLLLDEVKSDLSFRIIEQTKGNKETGKTEEEK